MILRSGRWCWLVAGCCLTSLAGGAACDKSPLLAPTSSTITLSANATVLPVNGSTDITATVIESAGTAVQNGTTVTFATTLGSVDPREARTHNGQAIVRFNAGNRSGEAVITALSGSATPPEDSEPLTIRIGAAAVGRISLTANPATLPSQGGTSEVVADVFDVSGNPLPGVAVSFTVDAGSGGSAEISNPVVTTNSNGEARTRVTTTNDVTISATVGGGSGDNGTAVSATFTVRVNPIPVLTISLTGTTTPAPGQIVTFTLTTGTGQTLRDVRVRFGDGDSATVGNLSGSSTLSHVYTREGTFKVTATGTDNRGETATSSIVVEVVEGETAVTISTGMSVLKVGSIVTFTVTTPATSIVERVRWDFGDGNTAATTGLVTSHVYGSPGVKTVTVRVETSNAGTGTGQIQIFINP